MASRSSSEEKKPRKKQQQVYESEGEESEDYAPPQRRRRGQQQQQQGPLDNLQLGNVGQTAGGLVGGVTNTLGGVAGQAVDQKGGGGGKSDTLRLRLDLNLDIEITLKAKIHGDLELALLYVPISLAFLNSPLFPFLSTQKDFSLWNPPMIMYILPSLLYLSCFLPRLKVDVEKLEQDVSCRRWREGSHWRDGDAWDGRRRDWLLPTVVQPFASRTMNMIHDKKTHMEFWG